MTVNESEAESGAVAGLDAAARQAAKANATGMRFLVFQHVASETPGSFRTVMQARGATMQAVELDAGEAIPPPAGFDALLVMGGPMDVWEQDRHPWLKAEIAFIRDWVQAGKPYLGICLGAQLLAAATGGEVGLMAAPEIGMRELNVAPDPLFAGLERCTGLEWHGAEVKALPPGARLLAANQACPVQAFALGQAAYGLQFHLELTETSTTAWGKLPEYAAALERVNGPGALPALAAEVDAQFPALHRTAQAVFGNFMDLAGAALARPQPLTAA